MRRRLGRIGVMMVALAGGILASVVAPPLGGQGGAFNLSARAQNLGVAVSPILTLDSERVFAETSAGQQITQELEQRLAALVAENRKIEAELEAEEKELTAKRATLPREEFRALADAFDEKVQRIRDEQDAKQRELQRLREEDRQSFVDRIAPILSQIGRERGAVAIIERRDLLLSADGIDITQEAIARINAILGPVPDLPAQDGTAQPGSPEPDAPQPEVEPALPAQPQGAGGNE